jgi:hypothetical protein
MKCVQCIYCGQSPEIGLKIFTIIFVYCISVVLKTLQIQHKIVNAMKLCPSVIKSTVFTQYAPVVVVLVYITLKIFIKSCYCQCHLHFNMYFCHLNNEK